MDTLAYLNKQIPFIKWYTVMDNRVHCVITFWTIQSMKFYKAAKLSDKDIGKIF